VTGLLDVGDGPALEVSVRIGARKEIRVNGKAVADRMELLANTPCIVFAHDDLEFVTGSPERRRWFFNQTLGLTDVLFIDALRRYRRVLRLRNAAIREGGEELLEHYDQALALTGLEIMGSRRTLAEGFNETFSPLYRSISGLDTPPVIEYRPSWRKAESPEAVIRLLGSRREADRGAGMTTTGPHRDGYAFRMGGHEMRESASTGQLRLCSLVLRVAQAEYFGRRTGRNPILLLDDVILELDPRRKQAFMRQLPRYEQAFCTFLPDEEYAAFRRERTLLYTVQAGRIQPWSP
jgi:DNA replication and repair protein RecF